MNRRVVGGRLAKAQGQGFENLVLGNADKCGYYAIQIPTGCKVLAANKLIRVPTPFDFVLASPRGQVLFFDAKTLAKGRFRTSAKFGHQVDHLRNLAMIGHHAGFLVWFRDVNAVRWYNGLLDFSKSLGPEEGIDLGTGHEIDFGRLK